MVNSSSGTSPVIPVFTIVRKDIVVWLQQPTSIAATIAPAIAFMVILYLGAQAVGRNPVAIVVMDSGPHAQELLKILTNSDAFKVAMVTTKQQSAEEALKQLKVAGVITIPGSFDAAFDAHKPDPVTIHINNLNLDFTNDLRRSLPAAITEFYADRNNDHDGGIGGTSGSSSNDPIRIYVKEVDLRQQDVDLLRFEFVPILVLLLTTAGIVNTGLATAREWEDSTIKELLLAPIPKTSLIAGKLLSGWLTTLLIAGIVLVIGAASGYLMPEKSIYWISTVGIVLLIALATAGLGVAIGAAARSFERVTAIGILGSIDLFFLSGGITVAAFLPVWLQTIAHFVPTFYGTHALQMAIFYNSSEGLVQDVAVLAGTALAATGLGVLSLRKMMLS
jgi:ABC-type multidrug transport system permease subunit